MRVAIIGGGIGGASTAIALRRVGCEVAVYERAPEPREVGAGISMMPNAVRCLDFLGVGDAVRSAGEGWTCAEVRRDDGRVRDRFEADEVKRLIGFSTVMIHRADLLGAILGGLPGDCVRFGRELADIAEGQDSITAIFTDGSRVEADLLVGADGLNSRLRALLFGDEPPRYSGQTCWRGVCTAQRLHGEGGTLEPGCVAEVWGTARRFGIAPIGKGRIYWWAAHTTREGGPHAGETNDAKARVLELFSDWAMPVPHLVRATEKAQVIRNDLYDRPALATWSRGRAVLIGDAAHPTTPNLGQGGCTAIEDGVVLANVLATGAGQRRALGVMLEEFRAVRAARTDKITRVSRLFGEIGQGARLDQRVVRDYLMPLIPKSVRWKEMFELMGYNAVEAGKQPRST